MKGEMIMEKKDFTKLTADEALDIIISFREKGGCSKHQCGSCPANSVNYLNVAVEGECNKTFIDRLKDIAYGKHNTSDTIDTIQITPETTDIDFMISTGYVHDLAGALTKEVTDTLCKTYNCTECKLGSKNFSKLLRLEDCSSRIRMIKVLSLASSGRDIQSIKRSNNNTCSGCGYCSKVGEFLFCTAWKNYTNEDMYCGYHKPIDK